MRTYLRTEVLNCRRWGPGPRRWLWVQTWPSVLCYLISSREIIQLQTKRCTVSRAGRSDRNIYLNKYSQFNGYRAGFDQKMILSTRSDLFPKESWVGCESDAQFGEKCARRTSNSHIRINSFGDNVMPLWVHSFWR